MDTFKVDVLNLALSLNLLKSKVGDDSAHQRY